MIQLGGSQLIERRLISSVGLVGVTCFLSAAGCASSRMPPPEDAAEKYATAIETADAEKLHEMLTSRARGSLSVDEIRRILVRDKKEHEVRARHIRAGAAESCRGEATLYLDDGRSLALALESGGFHLDSPGVLPGRPTTPEAAMHDFAQAVHARDFQRIRGLLSPLGEAQLDEVMMNLDASLSGLNAAVVDVRGDRAEVELPSGVRILLVRKDGIWRVEELR